jgi:hypothetical protein
MTNKSEAGAALADEAGGDESSLMRIALVGESGQNNRRGRKTPPPIRGASQPVKRRPAIIPAAPTGARATQPLPPPPKMIADFKIKNRAPPRYKTKNPKQKLKRVI